MQRAADASLLPLALDALSDVRALRAYGGNIDAVLMENRMLREYASQAVSYTHLTLPTILLV